MFGLFFLVLLFYFVSFSCVVVMCKRISLLPYGWCIRLFLLTLVFGVARSPRVILVSLATRSAQKDRHPLNILPRVASFRGFFLGPRNFVQRTTCMRLRINGKELENVYAIRIGLCCEL